MRKLDYKVSYKILKYDLLSFKLLGYRYCLYIYIHFMYILYYIMSYFVICIAHYLMFFLAALCLCCCTRAFSSCGEQGLLFLEVCGLFTAVASLVAEHEL